MAFWTELKQKKITTCMETQNTQIVKATLRKKNGAGRSRLTSDYTTKLQQSRHYDTGIKTEI